jgi:hypothetical protein
MLHRTSAPRMEFHISRRARDLYQFDEALFALSGSVILADIRSARLFAHKLNARRPPERAIRAGQINAMGLIDELMHYVSGLYREQRRADVMRRALAWLEARLGRTAVDDALRRFADEFPPLAVYRGEVDLATYLAGEIACWRRRPPIQPSSTACATSSPPSRRSVPTPSRS